MIATLRLLVCAVAIALAGTILELAHPGWVNELATDLWALPNIRSKLHEELELGGELETEISAQVARMESKQRILQNVIAGRVTLIDAAARYSELDKGLAGDQPDRLRRTWPGRSVMERYCHQIVQTAEWELSEQPWTAAAVVARLKSELKAAAEAGAFSGE